MPTYLEETGTWIPEKHADNYYSIDTVNIEE
jgi:hypothetical protein